jgi:hypothetical protein
MDRSQKRARVGRVGLLPPWRVECGAFGGVDSANLPERAGLAGLAHFYLCGVCRASGGGQASLTKPTAAELPQREFWRLAHNNVLYHASEPPWPEGGKICNS